MLVFLLGGKGVKSRADSIERRASASSLALSHCAMWRVEGEAGGRKSGPIKGEDMEVGSWVCGSMPMDTRRFRK